MATKKKQPTAASVTKAPQRVAGPSVHGNFSAFCAIVSDAQKDSAEAALAGYDVANGTGFTAAFVPYYTSNWDGITEPAPPIMAWMQYPQFNNLAVAAHYQTAMNNLASMGVRVYIALTNFESGSPANTVNSIYANGYDPELPMGNVYAAVAAWMDDVGGGLPARSEFPEGNW
jgi:hypothetical protein